MVARLRLDVLRTMAVLAGAVEGTLAGAVGRTLTRAVAGVRLCLPPGEDRPMQVEMGPEGGGSSGPLFEPARWFSGLCPDHPAIIG